MKTLRIAVQKSGRLHADSLQLLQECGIDFDTDANKLKVASGNFPAEVLYLRNADIPQYLEDGVADIGIIGENAVVEKPRAVDVVQRLGFARCRLSLAIPKSSPYSSLEFFCGKSIATSYPNTVRGFFEQRGMAVDIHEISGSVEIAPSIGLADAVCDLVSSGNTLFSNGLREVHTILHSEAVIAASTRMDAETTAVLNDVLLRVRSVLAARQHRYILLNIPTAALPEVVAVLPGMKSPTVMPLAQTGWSSLHSVVQEHNIWSVIAQLKQLGAQGILVIPIQTMVV